tara:strand:- start:2934 stop:3650 length:717 start_codon:yes stop_codon:yes gene_type:complete
MKAIILCAGKGTRMLINYPKSLIKTNNNKSLLKNIFLNFKKSGFKKNDIILATGYKHNLIKKEIGSGPKYIFNKKFGSTNMVYTLMSSIKNLDEDIILSYADLVYDYKNIVNLKNDNKDFVTLVDKKWMSIWKKKNKLESDSETLKIKNNKITELGKKTKSIKDIDARYVGVTKIKKSVLNDIRNFFFKELKKNSWKFYKIDMTNFFNILIKNGYIIESKQILKNWNEFDDAIDLDRN